MKKFLFSFSVTILLTGSAFSQGLPMIKGNPVDNNEFRLLKQKHQRNLNPNRELIDVPFYIDYSVLDNLDQGATEDYSRFVWPLNSNYVEGDGNVYSFAGVIFRKWAGYTDTEDPQGTFDETQPGSKRFIHIDSVFVPITHENNSGQENSVILQISRQSATGGFSQSAPILWKDTAKTTTSLSPSGNWLGANALVTLSYAPNLDMPVNTFPGISLKYLAPKSDSLGFLGAFTPNPDGPAAGNAIPLRSKFPYSFVRWPGRFDNAIFSPAGNGVYYVDSQGKAQIDATSGDTVFFFIQNLEIWILGTVREVQGIEENGVNGVRLGNIFPNPMNETAGLYVSLEQPSQVSVEIYDLAGKLVSAQPQGRLMNGENKITIESAALAPGAYMYRVLANGAPSVARKFTVVR
jgi:hypothetical protein